MTKQEFSNDIKSFKFRELFNEMGWNNDKTTQNLVVEKDTYKIIAVAEKCGLKIVTCHVENLPNTTLQKKIDTQIRKLFFHYLLIFIDKNENQKWLIPIKKSEGRNLVTIDYASHQVPEFLFQKVSQLSFSLEQEEQLTIVDVSKLINDTFIVNSEKITKQFYDKFKKEHTSFLTFIEGIDDKINKDWYASLMLNRLMFCYFIQKKGFLNQDKDYLRTRLNASQEKKGKDKFYSFYRNFLLSLFHQGLGAPNHNEELKKEIGKIPYLNGGLFDIHELETTYKTITIDDKAFEKLFDFFDQYEWHLDTNIAASGKDINPDVIGYIFEKYINDRANMGAYYTKEDITDYISKNCILPFLFDETKRHYPKAFDKNNPIWEQVKNSGDQYIYDAIKKGVALELPEEIEAGIATVSKRTEWNKPAPLTHALPTEIWREVVDRRNRYNEIKSKIEAGEITAINDFITYNLNIREFAQDVVEETTDAEFLKHFYKALTNVTIIDPTCGSGAFLFAAMNILEPLYESCIQRMENFVAEAPKGKYKFFEEIIAHVKSPQHPNLQYFIYKSIILKNLYGVDIMKEAVEIAKLRLFLKLVATVEADYRKPNLGLEPLPDVDFNIRAGNTLVGFATEAELDKALDYTMDGIQAKPIIDEKCDIVSKAFARYKEIQLSSGDDYTEFKKAKEELHKRLKALNHELNQLLHKQAQAIPYDKWLTSHQPFHWFAEYYEIIHDRGGFDVIIGNPPYVEYAKVRDFYRVHNYVTEKCGNLYAYVMEQSLKISNKNSLIGFIVPISITTTPRMELLNKLYEKGNYWLSNFAVFPQSLFSDVHQRISIVISYKSAKNEIFTTSYKKWLSDERETLVDNIKYSNTVKGYLKLNNKIGNNTSLSIINKVYKNSKTVSELESKISKYAIYYKNTGVNSWLVFSSFAPKCMINGIETPSSRETHFYLKSQKELEIASCLLNSSLFYLFYTLNTNCRDLNPSDLRNFRLPLSLLNIDFSKLYKKINKNFNDSSKPLIRNQKQTGIVEIQSFRPRDAKPIIDEIDTLLAQHYGFTDEELDFIINYDIKYRMGKELDNEEE